MKKVQSITSIKQEKGWWVVWFRHLNSNSTMRKTYLEREIQEYRQKIREKKLRRILNETNTNTTKDR